LRRREKSAILEALDPAPGESILDVGCGAGFYARELSKRGARVIGLDSSPRMAEEFERQGLVCERTDFLSFSSPAPFDKLLLAGSAEFMSDPRLIMEKVRALLPVGGRAVVLAPPRNVFGALYCAWHRLAGSRAYLHDHAAGLALTPGLRLAAVRDVTPISRLLVVERCA
jgi:SAM-dependent methyltransferase